MYQYTDVNKETAVSVMLVRWDTGQYSYRRDSLKLSCLGLLASPKSK